MAKESLEELLKQVIQASDRTTLASNRTTRAVRAFVRFLFIQLTAITIALFINILANLGDEGPIFVFQIMAFLVWMVGLIWSSIAGWSELHLSDPDAHSDSQATPESDLNKTIDKSFEPNVTQSGQPTSKTALEERNWL